jgi:hypothetical protein
VHFKYPYNLSGGFLFVKKSFLDRPVTNNLIESIYTIEGLMVFNMRFKVAFAIMQVFTAPAGEEAITAGQE